jgi:uncharacterized protein (DUF1697 family)
MSAASAGASAGAAWVVFLRGVNVGGNKTFRPAALAAELGYQNIGAAGTFVVPGGSERAVRAAIVKRLAFAAEVMVCRAEEIVDLVRAAPARKLAAGVKPYVSILGAPPLEATAVPVARPTEKAWQVKIERVVGRYAIGVWRRLGTGRMLYPNEVVEKTLGVSATTRGWDTLTAVYERL